MSAVTAFVVGLAAVALGMELALILAVIRLDDRISKLEDYRDKQRESFARLQDSDAAREFKAMHERWNGS